jgi:NitT/TauT family transport system ATP-binding protein
LQTWSGKESWPLNPCQPIARPDRRHAKAAHLLPRRSALVNTLTDTPFVCVERVSKRFETRGGAIQALADVDLDVAKGEFVSIIGPSGCGKSTLLMIVAGLAVQSAGRVQIGAAEVNRPYTELGIVFQQDALLDWRSVLRNVLLQAQIRHLESPEMTERARELLGLVGLDGFEKMYPHELSGGMRQRVAICRALLHRPGLLLMDEPFGALDALTRDQLNVDLLRLWSGEGMTVLFVTHSIPEAVFLSDRVLVMAARPGRIEATIPIDLPRPRRLSLRNTPAFIEHTRAVSAVFEKDGVLREA